MIRSMKTNDNNAVLCIYKKGIESRNATFEVNVPEWDSWDSKHLKHSRLIYMIGNNIVGWAALSPVSSREAYNGVAEVSIYIDPNYSGRGIGKELLNALIRQSEENGIWTLYSSIFEENIASIRIHEKNGFRRIGYRERIAKLDGKWRNTVLFERRSRIVGV